MKFVLFVAVLSLALPLMAQSNLDEVRNKIQKETQIDRLQVTPQGGSVVLQGEATTLKDAVEAQEIANHILKKKVVNQINVAETQKTDQQINLEVVDRIRSRAAAYPIFNDLSVKTEGGNVTLIGKVRDAYLADEAVKAAMEIEGVRTVTNGIQVLPASTQDDRLRVAVYRRLRNDDRLFNYFLGSQSSINIIVDHSRVTLTGYVNSDVDRVLAGSIVRHMFGILSVDNRLKVG